MRFEIERAARQQKQSIYNEIFIFTIYDTKVNFTKKNFFFYLFFYR